MTAFDGARIEGDRPFLGVETGVVSRDGRYRGRDALRRRPRWTIRFRPPEERTTPVTPPSAGYGLRRS
jgi:hypothetical protein